MRGWIIARRKSGDYPQFLIGNILTFKGKYGSACANAQFGAGTFVPSALAVAAKLCIRGQNA
jgi:hypothetical protein